MPKPCVVFVNPPLGLEERYGALSAAANTMPALGVCNLAAVARREGYRVGLVEACSLGLGLEGTVSAIMEHRPDFVGLSALTLSINSAASVAGRLKEINPRVGIIIGGAHVTAVPELTMELFPPIDVGALGEGEGLIVDLLAALSGGDDISSVSGIIYRNDGDTLRTERRPFLEDMDELPFPAFDLLPRFPLAYHPGPFRFRRLPAASIVTSRGCPNKCTFCDRSVFGSKCRAHSPAYIVNMLKWLISEYGIREVLFEDDTFFLFPARVREICEMILSEGIDLSWSCLARVNAVEPKVLSLLKKAGCWQIGYGIESGNQRILDLVGKGIKLEAVRRAVRWTKEAGIFSKGFFITGNQTEDEGSLRETMELALSIPLDDITVTMLTPFPGSQIYREAASYGDFDDDWRKMNLVNAVFVPRGLTRSQLEEQMSGMYRKFYLRPRIIVNYIGRMFTQWRAIPAIFLGFVAFLKTAFGRKKAQEDRGQRTEDRGLKTEKQ